MNFCIGMRSLKNEAFKDIVIKNSKWIWDYALFMALRTISAW